MSENLKVSPTPIQRNRFDVAVELTQIHIKSFGISEGELEKVYAKYFATAKLLDVYSGKDLKELVSNEIKEKISALNNNSGW